MHRADPAPACTFCQFAATRNHGVRWALTANGLEPYAYLRHVFTELPKAQTLEALLPW